MDVNYNPYDPSINDDPYPVYARLRRDAPLYHNPELGFWALSRHADVAAALVDSARYSSDHGPMIDAGAWTPQARAYLSFVAMDPPDHTRMRAVVSRAFTPRRIAALEPMIREIARAYIEEGLAKGTFDFAADLAAKLPLDVISELMGVPSSRRHKVRRTESVLLRHDLATTLTESGLRGLLSLGDYYASVVAQRRAEPRDDLVSALVADGDLTDEEIVAFLFLLIGAGSETTTHLLCAAWYWAWRNPEQREIAFDGGVPQWVEESLRYDTPAHGTARRLTGPTELHGVLVPRDAKMWVLIGSANRDEDVFPDPDVYDLGRDTSRAISFGVGRHYCLGAALARLEGRITLEELTKAVAPDYHIHQEGIRRTAHGNVRGMISLPTTARPA
ncbi:cytochrome P450 [Nonomuraea wenchangensis]|uniref:cytochrome P450 n=1 Tax=Nonomuraea wenchangensis TaxID=568860 RepID=UPI0037110841